jgi:transcription elongation factor S-II
MSQKFKDKKSYTDKARSLIFNLKDPQNPRLKTRILEGDLTPWDIVTADSRDLASDSKKAEREKTTEENMQARRSDYFL